MVATGSPLVTVLVAVRRSRPEERKTRANQDLGASLLRSEGVWAQESPKVSVEQRGSVWPVVEATSHQSLANAAVPIDGDIAEILREVRLPPVENEEVLQIERPL